MTRERQLLWAVLFLLLGLGILKAGFELSHVLVFEARGAMDSDVLLFFTVGRGWLNGFLPYIELFESKPPGIFVLTAVSLLLTNGPYLMTALSVSLFVAFPILLTLSLFHLRSLAGKHTRAQEVEDEKTDAWSVLAALTTFLIGLLLMLYTEERAGMMLSEFWGGMFGSLYVLVLVWRGWSVRVRTALAALCILGSVGMKEPFLLVLLGAALLIVRSRKEFFQFFVMPLFIAGATGLIALFVLGLFVPYFDLYLPAMLAGRAGSGFALPLWAGGFAGEELVLNMTTYYESSAFLGLLFAVLWFLVPVFRSGRVSHLTAMLSALYMYLLFELMEFARNYVTVQVYAQSGKTVDPEEWRAMIIMAVVSLGVVIALQILLYKRKFPVDAALGVVALYCITMMVSMGGYVGNHFILALPGFTALVILFARFAVSVHRNNWIVGGIAIATAFIALSYSANPRHMQKLESRLRFTPHAQQDVTTKLDALMDACAYDRYFAVGALPELAFTKHSTVGPLPIITYHEYLPIDHPLVRGTYENVRALADVIIAHPENLQSAYNVPVAEAMDEVFTTEVPACASHYMPIGDFLVVFRR